MTASAAYNARVLLQIASTSTAFAATPTTRLAANAALGIPANRHYQITSELQRTLDRNANFTVRVNGTTATTPYTLDYLNGIIRFDSAVTGVVDIAGRFFPMHLLAAAKSYSLEMSAEILDTTSFDGGVSIHSSLGNPASDHSGFRQKEAGLFDVTITIGSWVRALNQQQTFINFLSNNRPAVVEIRPAAGGVIKGFFVLEDRNRSGDVAGLEELELTFKLDADPQTAISWS